MSDAERECLLEEYRVVVAEKEQQYRNRDTASVFALTAGITLLGYAIQQPDPSALFYAGPLVLFLTLYVHYVARVLLGLKADAYIRVYLEPRLIVMGWYERKSGYGLGPMYRLNTWVIVLLFTSLIGSSFFFLAQEVPWWAAVLIGVAVFAMFGLAVHEHWSGGEEFLTKWRDRADEEGLTLAPHRAALMRRRRRFPAWVPVSVVCLTGVFLAVVAVLGSR